MPLQAQLAMPKAAGVWQTSLAEGVTLVRDLRHTLSLVSYANHPPQARTVSYMIRATAGLWQGNLLLWSLFVDCHRIRRTRHAGRTWIQFSEPQLASPSQTEHWKYHGSGEVLLSATFSGAVRSLDLPFLLMVGAFCWTPVDRAFYSAPAV